MIPQPIFLFISGAEIGLILLIAVMVFGADKLPEIARGLSKGMRTLKDATDDIKTEITKTADEVVDTKVSKDVKESIGKIKDEIDDFTGSIKREL